MADPNVDTAVYRMKAYAALLLEDPEKKGIGMDIALLCGWIEHAKPFLGDISIDVVGTQQDLYAARKKAPDVIEPANPPDPLKPVISAEGGGDAEKPAT